MLISAINTFILFKYEYKYISAINTFILFKYEYKYKSDIHINIMMNLINFFLLDYESQVCRLQEEYVCLCLMMHITPLLGLSVPVSRMSKDCPGTRLKSNL